MIEILFPVLTFALGALLGVLIDTMAFRRRLPLRDRLPLASPGWEPGWKVTTSRRVPRDAGGADGAEEVPDV
ncbi:MAG: hypothetical protein GY719_26240 [bacterium]|nr:hypothetical protein [bacterium]